LIDRSLLTLGSRLGSVASAVASFPRAGFGDPPRWLNDPKFLAALGRLDWHRFFSKKYSKTLDSVTVGPYIKDTGTA